MKSQSLKLRKKERAKVGRIRQVGFCLCCYSELTMQKKSNEVVENFYIKLKKKKKQRKKQKRNSPVIETPQHMQNTKLTLSTREPIITTLHTQLKPPQHNHRNLPCGTPSFSRAADYKDRDRMCCVLFL